MRRLLVPSLAFLLIAPSFVAQASDDAWHPSRYGADDTLGAINELSPEGVVAAAQLVKTGKTYALGVETGRDTPAFGSRSFELYAVAHGDGTGETLGANRATAHDDWMLTYLGIGTQLDGLAHLGIDHVYYNGTRAQDLFQPTGVTKFATHTLPPIVTRGVVLDVAGHRGVARLAAGDVISADELAAVAEKQGTPIARGDVVLVHTGWQVMASNDAESFLAGEPGIDVDGAVWLAEQGVVAVGADTWGVEVFPNPKPELLFPVHQTLLAKNGIYILENTDTAELVRDGTAPFLFVLGQPRFVGAVQMVVNPVAIR